VRQLESAALEEQAVEWLLGRAQVTDRPMSFKELTGFGQSTQEQEHDHEHNHDLEHVGASGDPTSQQQVESHE
jgi:hypothetical protein